MPYIRKGAIQTLNNLNHLLVKKLNKEASTTTEIF